MLFEILIALSLTAILLSFLFSFLVGSAKMEKRLETARAEITSRALVQTRLQAVLSSLHAGSEHLYTKRFERESSPSLIATFDNGIDPDPAYSGPILGRVFIDEEKNLCLASWPLGKEKKQPWRKEILLSNVKSFEFAFLGKNNGSKHDEKEHVSPLNAALAWHSAWAKSQSEIPSMIRLTVQKEKEALRFAFILPSVEPFVTYTEKKAV